MVFVSPNSITYLHIYLKILYFTRNVFKEKKRGLSHITYLKDFVAKLLWTKLDISHFYLYIRKGKQLPIKKLQKQGNQEPLKSSKIHIQDQMFKGNETVQ